ncbi:hypothetical protein PMAYCL1PPCAC_02455, partial [Pristionchus mayeri]
SILSGGHPYKCEACKKGFMAPKQLSLHKERFCRPKLCTLCPRRFKEDLELEKHLKKHRDGMVTIIQTERKYPCEECGKKYKGRGALIEHRLVHLEGIENQRPFQCDLCDLRFRRKADANYHKRLKHPEAIMPKNITSESGSANEKSTRDSWSDDEEEEEEFDYEEEDSSGDEDRPTVPTPSSTDNGYRDPKVQGNDGSLLSNEEKWGIT